MASHPLMFRERHEARREARRRPRTPVNIPGRLTWRDARGMPRFATVATRDVSEDGVYLDCQSGEAIPMYRLVYFQLEREARDLADMPVALRDGRVLSAVMRLGPNSNSTGAQSGYALRLLVDPLGTSAAGSEAHRSIA